MDICLTGGSAGKTIHHTKSFPKNLSNGHEGCKGNVLFQKGLLKLNKTASDG